MHDLVDPVDISTSQLGLVCDILHKHLPAGTRVWAFGSRAKWETTDASDLDLAVENDKPIDHNTLINLSIDFDDSVLPYTVDVADLKTVNSKFKKIIDDQKVLLETINSKFINDQWHEVRLGDFAPFSYGKPLPSGKRDSSGDIPVAGSGGVVGYHNVGLTSGHAIVIGRKGTVGAVHYFSNPCWPIDTTFYVTGTDPLLMRFKYYVLLTLDLKEMNFDSAIPGLNRTVAHAKLLSVPNEQEQKSIAYILGTLDAKIDLYHKMNRVLEDMARVLFKSWFVDFEPVRAKMDGRWKSGKSILGLSADFYDLFPNQLADFDLKHIPKGWAVKSIGDVARILGKTSTKIDAYWTGGMHCWATPNDLSALHSSVLLNTKQKITDAGLQQTGSGLLPPGTILLSSRAPIDCIAITEIPVAINQGLVAMLPGTGISSHFLHRWCEVFHDEIINCAGDSASFEIDKSNFQKIPIVVPGTQIMSAYHKLALILYGKIIVNERSLSNLIAQRDALMPLLVSGKLRIFKSHYESDV